MSNYVQLGDVHTYYEEDGEGEALVLLHPGLADSRAFEEYVPEFAQHFRVFRPDRRGHGRTPDVEGLITYEQMARDTIAFLERVVGDLAYVLGHSDGAIVALLAALKRPDLVQLRCQRASQGCCRFGRHSFEKVMISGAPTFSTRPGFGFDPLARTDQSKVIGFRERGRRWAR